MVCEVENSSIKYQLEEIRVKFQISERKILIFNPLIQKFVKRSYLS